MVAVLGIALLLATVRWNNHRPHHAVLALVVGVMIADTAVGRFVRSLVETVFHALTHLH
ncbi:hypothetical protein [Streptacidiphilus melanogenes]|uniref:hypothetical protein n=1 Tax=Streptacidiphilus melanogenes TaxID=411235 RepID=UPI000A6BEF8F|nr:hypothetical protein [Streptacidiphilus melanogenes]